MYFSNKYNFSLDRHGNRHFVLQSHKNIRGFLQKSDLKLQLIGTRHTLYCFEMQYLDMITNVCIEKVLTPYLHTVQRGDLLYKFFLWLSSIVSLHKCAEKSCSNLLLEHGIIILIGYIPNYNHLHVSLLNSRIFYIELHDWLMNLLTSYGSFIVCWVF